ncbi:MAG: hypothetical protein IPM01_15335 [Burkholderiaceae bacterium]|nr:hypothetical protein [Burkholderiaceae bacterium]
MARWQPRDPDRVFERLRQVGEALGHFGLRQKILLVGELARTARVGQYFAFGDAHAGLVGTKFGAGNELHRMGGHQRQAEVSRRQRLRGFAFQNRACRCAGLRGSRPAETRGLSSRQRAAGSHGCRPAALA